MKAKPEYRDRGETQVAVLDALADRGEEGMTVFELRSVVDVDIDRLETALSDLKEDDLIEATSDRGQTVIVPDDAVVGEEDPEPDLPLLERVRRKLPF